MCAAKVEAQVLAPDVSWEDHFNDHGNLLFVLDENVYFFTSFLFRSLVCLVVWCTRVRVLFAPAPPSLLSLS
jgi:hypothetical protein